MPIQGALQRLANWKAALALVIISGLMGSAFWCNKRGPEEAIHALSNSVERHDWSTLYSLSSHTERKMNGWNSGAFETLCSRIARHMPQGLGKLQYKDVTIEAKSEEILTLENPMASRRFLIFFPNAPEENNGQKAQAIVGVRRDRDGDFYVDVSYVLLYLNKMAGGSAYEKRRRLANALESAGLEAIVAVDTQKRLTRSDLLNESHASP